MSGKRNKKGGTTGIHLQLNKRNPETTDDIVQFSADSIPNSIGEKKLNILTEGDSDPYFFAQAIKFPIEANGDIYGEEFFKSFVERNKDHAFPGDKYGHSVSWYSRQPTHFHQVGSMIVGNVAYFKFYVPPKTDSEENESFIKEIKTNGIDLSLVAKVEYSYNQEDEKYHMNKSVGGERNDAVGFGDGSMDQIVINKKNDIEEGLEVTPEELLIKLNAMIVEGKITDSQLKVALNKSDLLKSEKDIADLKVLNSLSSILGETPVEKANELITKINADAEVTREAELVTAFGEVKNADGSDNMVRIQGALLLGEKVANKVNVEAVKANATFIAVCGNLADENSELNKINKNVDDTPAGEIKYVEV